MAIISLNRPEVRNCISLAVTTELDEAFTAACRDHAVRVMVLRAVGPNFSSGVMHFTDKFSREISLQPTTRTPCEWLRWRSSTQQHVNTVNGLHVPFPQDEIRKCCIVVVPLPPVQSGVGKGSRGISMALRGPRFRCVAYDSLVVTNSALKSL